MLSEVREGGKGIKASSVRLPMIVRLVRVLGRFWKPSVLVNCTNSRCCKAGGHGILHLVEYIGSWDEFWMERWVSEVGSLLIGVLNFSAQ
jgi:hypothetical protein